jgi:hypothetical protein
VGTPGRVLDLIETRKVLKVGSVKHFVLDECDRLLAEVDMRRTVQSIFKYTPHEKQVRVAHASVFYMAWSPLPHLAPIHLCINHFIRFVPSFPFFSIPFLSFHFLSFPFLTLLFHAGDDVLRHPGPRGAPGVP